jgi:hypothetical protein
VQSMCSADLLVFLLIVLHVSMSENFIPILPVHSIYKPSCSSCISVFYQILRCELIFFPPFHTELIVSSRIYFVLHTCHAILSLLPDTEIIYFVLAPSCSPLLTRTRAWDNLMSLGSLVTNEKHSVEFGNNTILICT